MFREKDIQQNILDLDTSIENSTDEDFDTVLEFLTLLIKQDLNLKGEKND